MLKVGAMPIILKMLAKLDIRPLMKTLQGIDIFQDGQKSLTAEQAGLVAFEALADLTPQLGKISDDIPEFVAMYMGVPKEEAAEMDFAVVVNEIVNDEGIVRFFSRALRKKVEQEQ